MPNWKTLLWIAGVSIVAIGGTQALSDTNPVRQWVRNGQFSI